MTRDAAPSLRSLEARLRNLALDRGIPERRVRRLIGIVVLGQFLAKSRTAVIKGASNLEVRLGTVGTRVSSDLDTIRRSTIEQFREQLGATMRTGWSGFTGVLADDGEIAIPVPDGYRPHRFRAKLEYIDRPFGTVQVEVAAEEVGGLDRIEDIASRDAAEWFSELGLPAPAAVPALPLAHQIAQKLHACTVPDTATWTNDRVHDLVDLQLAMQIYDGRLAEIRDIAVRLFAARRTHPWPPLVTARPGWRERYDAECAGLDVIGDVDIAVSWANKLLAQLVKLERE